MATRSGHWTEWSLWPYSNSLLGRFSSTRGHPILLHRQTFVQGALGRELNHPVGLWILRFVLGLCALPRRPLAAVPLSARQPQSVGPPPIQAQRFTTQHQAPVQCNDCIWGSQACPTHGLTKCSPHKYLAQTHPSPFTPEPLGPSGIIRSIEHHTNPPASVHKCPHKGWVATGTHESGMHI